MTFIIALKTVALMLMYAVPGYLMIRSKKLTSASIPSFAQLLVYVCAPAQLIYGMQKAEHSMEMLKMLGLTMLLSMLLMIAMLGAIFVLTRKSQQDVRIRICTTATALGNVGFMGIPLLEALLPDYPQAVAYSTAFSLSMNIIMWTIGSAIITRDIRYINLRKVFINPSSLAMYFSLILFFADIPLTGELLSFVTVLGRMSTALCMLILGMRLGAVPLKPIFTSGLQYATIAMKQLVFPLLALLLGSILPLDRNYVMALYILCCAPAANVVLSFAEILNEGQDTAANIVLLSTLLSIVTIPLMLLLV